ncbi:catalase [Natronorubrum sp. FCH18a]|uniref:catalase n=1 Tax=Natronorubrum sp. FCH18a TaxID=3447018 RepID=UPI003F50FB72
MAQFNRERIPERAVYAMGGSTYGTYTCTNDELSECTMVDTLSKAGAVIDLISSKPTRRDSFSQLC